MPESCSQGRDLQEAAVAPRRAMRALELVKEAQREVAHALEVLHAAVGAQEVVVHALPQHVRHDGALLGLLAVAVLLAVVLEEDAVAQAAARDDDVLAARELHERVDDDAARHDEVGALRREPLHALAAREVRLDDARVRLLEAAARNDVVVDARELVVRLGLVHLGEVSDRAADTDDGQVEPLGPRDHLFVLLAHEVTAALDGRARHLVGEVEGIRHRHGADRHGDRLDDLAVAHERDLDGCTAEVELQVVALVDGIDDAEVAEVRLALARDDLDVDARLLLDARDECLAIRSIARRRRRDRDALRDLQDLHHVLVDMEAGHGALHTLRIEPACLRHAAAETDGLLLLVFKTVGLVVGHLYDDEADRIRPHINDCHSLHKRTLPYSVLQSIILSRFLHFLPVYQFRRDASRQFKISVRCCII